MWDWNICWSKGGAPPVNRPVHHLYVLSPTARAERPQRTRKRLALHLSLESHHTARSSLYLSGGGW